MFRHLGIFRHLLMLKMVVAAASICRSTPDRDLRTNFHQMHPQLTKLLTAKG